MDIPIFILNFDNEIRKEKMQKRLNNFSIKFLKGYNLSEEEIIQYKINKGVSRNWNIQLSHLEMIKDFYFNTKFEYAIFCEDDVYIHKDLKNNISKIINDFKENKLDILLLSYLILNHPSNYGEKINNLNFEYYSYNNDLWGAHMYLLSRSYAKFLIDTFTIDWAFNNKDKPYSPDWIITKNGKRALIWPPFGVEEGEVNTTHQGQIDFHKNCKNYLYNKEIYY